MRIVAGAKCIEIATEAASTLLSAQRRIVVDVGTGDGRFVYEAARRDAETLYVGLDPDADAMAEYAYRAGRKPARGGVENLLYVVTSIEQLPVELKGVANQVHVNFPWAALLRGVILPEPGVLEGLGKLLRPDGAIEIVLTYDAEHDKGALAGESLPPLDEAYIENVLRPAYATHGLAIDAVSRLTREEALAIPSSWGRRLLHGRPRDVFRLRVVKA